MNHSPTAMRQFLILVGALCATTGATHAQRVPSNTVDDNRQPKVHRPTSITVMELQPKSRRTNARLDAGARVQPWKAGDAIRFVPKRTRPVATAAEPVNPTSWQTDQLLTTKAAPAREGGPDSFGTPEASFPGLGFSGAYPPDTVGAVGPDHYVQLINGPGGTSVAAWDKTGAPAFGPVALAPALGSGVCNSGAGDPIVLYDHLADRWLLSEFSGIADALCVYISQTSNPGSTYFAYVFPTTSFPDYPKYAVWPDAYFVTANQNLPTVYALDRADLLAGIAPAVVEFTVPSLAGFGFQSLTPANLAGPPPANADAPGLLLRHRDDEAHNPLSNNPTQDFLEIFSFDYDAAFPALSSVTGPTSIAVTEFDSTLCGLVSFSCFAQPGGGTPLDPLREVVMFGLQYRDFGSHATLVGNFVTDVNGGNRGGIRWFELRDTGSGWGLHQEGTQSPDTNNRWMGSAAMDASGNIALGYSVAGTSQFTDIRYAGRLASDPPGTLPRGEHTLVAGAGSQFAADRWGDYSAMSIDPADDCTFWYTNEYVAADSNWDTGIGAFRFASCSAVCDGNGQLGGTEQCDDGNLADGDGCSAACEIETGFVCSDPTTGGNAIADPSFEAGAPNPNWLEFSTNFGTPLCDDGCPGAGGTDGLWYAWFGGVAGDFEEGRLAQSVVIPTPASTLDFDLLVGVCDSATDFLAISLDGTEVFSTDPCTPDAGGYQRRSVDISTFADDGPHDLLLRSVTTSSNGGNSNFFLDQIAIDVPPQPSLCTPVGTDTDEDGILDPDDNCTEVANATQDDFDGDNIGDACDLDVNQDCIVEFFELNGLKLVFFTNAGDPDYDPRFDFDSDGSIEFADLNQLKLAFFTAPGPSGLPNICAP